MKKLLFFISFVLVTLVFTASCYAGEYASIKEAKEDVQGLREVIYSAYLAQTLSDQIEDGVCKGEFTWKDVGTTKKELKKLVLEAKKKEAKEDVQQLREVIYDYSLAQDIADEIEKWVSNGEFTWKDVGTTKEELKKLVSKAKAKK